MNKHLKRWLVASLAVATVLLFTLWVYQSSASAATAVILGMFVGLMFLYTHIITLAKDHNARVMSRKS